MRAGSTMKRAFVVAMECEAEAVRPALGPDDRLYVSGIGKVFAAAATQRAISEFGADEVVNCGLCGGFGDGMEVGDVYGVECAVEYDFDLSGINGTPAGVKDGATTPYVPVSSGGGFPLRRLATGDRFCDGDSDDALIASLGCTLRDMEGAAVAGVCAANGVRCVMFKCVSDVHGRGAMTRQYLDNRERALECLRRAAISLT